MVWSTPDSPCKRSSALLCILPFSVSLFNPQPAQGTGNYNTIFPLFLLSSALFLGRCQMRSGLCCLQVLTSGWCMSRSRRSHSPLGYPSHESLPAQELSAFSKGAMQDTRKGKLELCTSNWEWMTHFKLHLSSSNSL